MTILNKFRIALLSSVCMVPFAAYAADDTGFDLPDAQPGTQQSSAGNPGEEEKFDNSIDIGLTGQSSKNAYFGRYNGSYNDGVDVVSGFRFRGREDWKSSDTYYYDVTGKNLKFGYGDHFDLAPNSSVTMKVGNQGKWGLSLGWDASTYVQADDFTTLFDKNGHTVPGFSATATSLTAANISHQVVDVVGTRRDKGFASLNYIMGDWSLVSGLVHEHKEGTMEQSLTEGGSNGKFAYFPLPINYDTDRFDISTAFNTSRFQAKFGYTLSNFHDNNAGGYTYSPFLTSTVAGSTGVSGIYSQAPSNMAHQISTQLGYNLDPTTRLNANLSYGLQTQNDSYVQPTLNQTIAWSNYSNAGSLNGFVQTMFGNLGLTARPLPKVDFKMNYTMDARQVNTGEQTLKIPNGNYGDSGNAVSASNANVITRLAFPESWNKQTANVETGYKVLPSTKLSLGYTYTNFDRTEAIIRHTGESTITAKARTAFTPELVGSLAYDHGIRNASAPDFNIWTRWARGYSGGECNTLSTRTVTCYEVPSYEQSRNRDQVSGRLNWTVDHDLSLGVVSKVAADTYPNNNYGISRDDKLSVGPDLTYRISDDADAHAFYTFQHIYNTMVGPNNSVYTSSSRSNSAYGNDTNTVGLSGNWKVDSKLKLGSEYVFSYGQESVNQSGLFGFQSGGPSATPDSSMPLVTSMLNSFKLHGEYAYTPGISFYMGYAYDRLMTSDWALFGVVANNATNGQGNPNYNVHSVITRVSFKW